MIVTRDVEVLSSAPCDLAGLMSCTYEEAATVHATDGAEHGKNNMLLRTVDTDVVGSITWRRQCGGLPAFRALTGCDVTSTFAGNGKRTAWTAWDANDDATSAMCTFSRMPTTEIVMNVLPIIKRSIVIMYDRGSSESSVNGERLVLFTQQVKEIENIPPT